MLNYFDHHDKKVSKEHFLHLIQVANADGVIDRKESELLYRVGKRLGFTDPEISALIEKRDSKTYNPPYSLEERFHQLYDVVAMAMADGVMFTNEINMIKRLAIASSFSDADTERLINLLVNGIKQNRSEDELFSVFKMRK
ncbi:MAG: TerB family tellurite resistance protein [Bacteroidales bacterium]|nr:MAG: TerB family tellurite resistance protein [Bacteroidales bacterium]